MTNITDFILDTNTIPDCQRLRNYYLDLFEVDLDNSYLNPGYVWVYWETTDTYPSDDYGGLPITETLKHLYSMHLLEHPVDKNSYVVLTDNGLYTSADLYTSNGIFVDTTILSFVDRGTVTLFDYMICGCGDNATLCGKCCIYCCKIAEATKEYYEKILV